eukprot:Rmarinus@m.20242
MRGCVYQLTFILFLFSLSTYAEFTLALYFPFSEGVGDSTLEIAGKGFSATMRRKVDWSLNSPFPPGLSFFGTYDDSVRIPTEALAGIEDVPGVTISMWTALTHCSEKYFFFRGIAGNAYYHLGIVSFAEISVAVECSESGIFGWHHWAFVIEDTTHYPSIYLDGVPLINGSRSYSIEAPDGVVSISDYYHNAFHGYIDEVALFMEGLSAGEVTKLYQSFGYFNECAIGIHDCYEDASCTDTLLGFFCKCESSYTGDGVSRCIDITTCHLDDTCGYGAVRCEGDVCLCDAGFYGDGTACFPCSSNAT